MTDHPAALTYEELTQRLQEAEEVLLCLMSAETDAVVSHSGVYLLRLDEADRAVRAARAVLERTLEERTQQLRAELQRANQIASELRESEARFRTLAQAVPNLLWTTDASGLGTYVSARYEEFTGMAARDLVGHRWMEILHSDDQERVSARWSEAINTGSPYEVEYRLRRFDGTYRWFVARGVPMRDPDGQVYQWLGSSTEIDGMKRTEAALRRSNEELRQFAHAAAHDLQEPLRNVSNSVSVLKQRFGNGLEPAAQKWVETALDGAKRMHGMIMDLLAFARAVETDEEVRAPVSAEEAAWKALENLGGVIYATGGKVEIDPLPSVRVHELHLVQVFQNLLSNALKYRKPGVPAEIHVSASRSGGEYRFCVSDNGIGFDPMYSQKIFGVFRRLHTYTQYSGNGIGLAICARIVAFYGGRIWAESSPGEGATFHFTLPAE